MLDPKFMQTLTQQMDEIHKSLAITTQFQAQLDHIAKINEQFASQIDIVKNLSSSIYIPRIDLPHITIPDFEFPKIEIPVFEIPTIDTSQFLTALNVSESILEIVSQTEGWQSHFHEQIAEIAGQHTQVINSLATEFVALDLAQTILPLSDIFRDLHKLIGETEELAKAFNSANWIIAPSMDRRVKQRVVELYNQNKGRYTSLSISNLEVHKSSG